MLRLIIGIILGVVAWFVVALGIAFVLRAVAPGLSAQLAVHATVATLAGAQALSNKSLDAGLRLTPSFWSCWKISRKDFMPVTAEEGSNPGFQSREITPP